MKKIPTKNLKNFIGERRHTVAEAMEILRVSRPTVTRLVQAKAIACIRIRGRIFFTDAHLNEFLSKSERQAAVR